jgi:hypothetical protein
MSIEITHSNLMDLFQLPAGRRAYALAAVHAAAKKAKVELGDAGKAAVAANDTCRARDKAWNASRATGKASAGTAKLRRIDARIDKSVTGSRDAIAGELDDMDAHDDPATADRLRDCLDRHFPNGAVAYTKLPYVEEYAAVTALVADLRKEHADVVKLLGLERRLTRLSALLTEYKAEIDASNVGTAIMYKDVVQAREAAHEAMCALVAVVSGRWWRPEDAATRGALLAPIMLQNEKVAEARRGRREVEDIDPETGDPVAPDAPAGSAPPT